MKFRDKNCLAIYKEVTIPVYDTIKEVIVDGIYFENKLDIAQEYMNNEIILNAEEEYNGYSVSNGFDITLVLSADNGIFEDLQINFNDMLIDTSFTNWTLMEALFHALNELSFSEFEERFIKNKPYEEYKLKLGNYKVNDAKRLSLTYMHNYIQSDLFTFLEKYHVRDKDNEDVLKLAISILRDSYKDNIEKIYCEKEKFDLVRYTDELKYGEVKHEPILNQIDELSINHTNAAIAVYALKALALDVYMYQILRDYNSSDTYPYMNELEFMKKGISKYYQAKERNNSICWNVD